MSEFLHHTIPAATTMTIAITMGDVAPAIFAGLIVYIITKLLSIIIDPIIDKIKKK